MIKVNNLSKYYGDIKAVKSINFELKFKLIEVSIFPDKEFIFKSLMYLRNIV